MSEDRVPLLRDRTRPEAIAAPRRRPDIVIRRRDAEILVDPKPIGR